MNILFSDLDGTLLDQDSYSFDQAKKGLSILKESKIPLIFCSSKTRSEIEYWRKQLDNTDPFISENGGGIFIPKDYFSFPFLYTKKKEQYFVIEFGPEIERLVRIFKKLKKKYDIKSFIDMPLEEIAQDIHANRTQANLSKKREYDIPFKILNLNEKDKILNNIKKYNLNYTKGGRYFHLLGENSKGGAVKTLIYLYKKET